MKLKISEARILVLLKNLEVRLRFARFISKKLDMDYAYTLEILDKMVYKGWIQKDKQITKFYYHILKAAPLEEATRRLTE